MKKYFGTTLLFILIAVSIYGQDRILISVSHEIGTEVDREERDKHNWFPDVPNFISARFYYLPDGTYEVQIQFFQNGQVNEQRRVITPESFQKDYQNTLIVEKIEEKPVSDRRGRRRLVSYENHKERNVNLRLENSVVKDAVITGITKDSIITEKSIKKGGEIHVTHSNYAIANIEDISVIRTYNAIKTLAIGILPGFGAGLHTFIITRENGLFDDSSEEKAGKVFLMGEIIGLSISGSIAAIRNTDYDYILSGLSSEQKSEVIDRFIRSGLRQKTNATFSPWMGVYYFRNYLNTTLTFPGARLSLCFTPRSRMEITYGYSQGWSFDGKEVEIQRSYDKREYKDFHLLKIGFRVDQSYHKNLNVFIAWGWGVLRKRFKYYDRDYNYYSSEYYYHEEKRENNDIIMNIELGIEHHFKPWLSAEARIGIVENIDYGLHPMAQVGIQLGRFY